MNEEKDRMFCAAEIVKRAKLEKNFKTDSELAAFLGISRSTLSNWIARNSIDFPLVLGRFGDVDYNWLLTGNGSPALRPAFCESPLARGEVELIHNPKTTEALDDRDVSLYDISAAANLKTLLTDKSQHILGSIRIPNVPRCDGAVYVSGDSMYPILKAGDIIGFRSIQDFASVIFGEMYIVSFQRDGDEYLTVKYVNHSDAPDCLKLVSYNPHHDPMDLPLKDINAMGIVKFSIRKNLMM
ncbi:S24 family peptidase [Bacteroides helcogenes]|nr:S24 family peptidase [Bacteroides helcogenes]MDY5237793.1 S24 family peptidase [Bacteroides helcogenes]